MRNTILAVAVVCALAAPFTVAAQYRSSRSTKPRETGPVTVREHTSPKTGQTTERHQRTRPNQTETDNWATRGNTNPTTGKAGTKNPKR